MIEEGAKFPEFSLSDQHGRVVNLKDLIGSKAVVYFYPKDDTSGCTVEACEFRDAYGEIDGVRVLGVSPDDQKSHKKFSDKFSLNFSLLVDHEHALADLLGIWVEKSMYGKKYMGIERTTYVLDEAGIITKIFRKVKPQGHAAEVSASLG